MNSPILVLFIQVLFEFISTYSISFLTDLKSSKIKYDESAETVTITFRSAIPLGNAQLKVSFIGELNDKMKGFYRSKYKDANGEDKYCAVTQFEVQLVNVTW